MSKLPNKSYSIMLCIDVEGLLHFKTIRNRSDHADSDRYREIMKSRPRTRHRVAVAG